MQKGQAEVPLEGYHQYWCSADKKGYSGTAVFTKQEPLSVAYGIGIDEHDHEGRVITAEYDDFYLVNVYVPNSQDQLKRLNIFDCMECGSCAFTCPGKLPLVETFRKGKAMVREADAK